MITNLQLLSLLEFGKTTLSPLVYLNEVSIQEDEKLLQHGLIVDLLILN